MRRAILVVIVLSLTVLVLSTLAIVIAVEIDKQPDPKRVAALEEEVIEQTRRLFVREELERVPVVVDKPPGAEPIIAARVNAKDEEVDKIAPPEYVPDPTALALASQGSAGSVAVVNIHIARAVEKIRLQAVVKGEDADAAANQFLKEEVRHWRFLSWHTLVKDERFPKLQAAGRGWLPFLSTAPLYVAPVIVPESHGLIWRIDIRDYGWNADAWRAVALRETYTVHPAVDEGQIEVLQKFLGEKWIKVTQKTLLNGQPYDVVTYPSIGVVRADWFIRDTMETDRSPSHYDLLYAKRRFPPGDLYEEYTEQVPEKRLVQVYDSYRGYYWSEQTTYSTVTKRRKLKKDLRNAAVDFPRNKKDWEEFWGIKAAKDFLRKQKFDARYGGVVAGSKDNPVSGSIVTRNARIVVFRNGPFGGADLESIDTDKTSRDQDFIEHPVETSLDLVKGKAGELLITTPVGAQAGLLIDANGKRIERADGRFVHPKSADDRYPDVRTMMSCVVCHAPHGGVIPPKNLYREYEAKGTRLNIQDKIQTNQLKAFMKEWDHRIAGWQAPYFYLIAKATEDVSNPLKPVPPLKPADFVTHFLNLRNRYDDPVNAETAGLELGLTTEELRLIGSKHPTSRAQALFRGESIPRDVFEFDVYPQLAETVSKHRSLIESYRKLR